MIIPAPVKVGVSLEALLAAKDRRAARQADWLARHQQPIISLTLVTPGAVKDSERYRDTMAVALKSCEQQLWQRRWGVLEHQTLWLPTGAEALWCVAHSAAEIKALCVDIEQTHPLGRLWDFDVFCPERGPIGRHAMDINVRRCLICDEAAHACARSRRHPVEQVVEQVERLIDDWFTYNGSAR